MEKESILFTPGKIGPLTLRNRTIRAAAFESMCPGNAPSDIGCLRRDRYDDFGLCGCYAKRTFFRTSALDAPRYHPRIKTHHRCHPQRRGGCLRTTRTLRKHVSQKHLRVQAYLRIQRFQYLFPYPCPWNETFRNHSYGKSVRTSSSSGARSRNGCSGNTCRSRLSDQPVSFSLYQSSKRRIWR